MRTKFFGQYLLERGRISSQQLLDAVERQKTVTLPVGTMALERGWLTADQIRQALEQQKRSNQRFGEIAVTAGWLKQDQLDQLLQEQDTSHRVRLGEVLTSRGYLSLEALESELKAYNVESEKVSSEVSQSFNGLEHRDIVRAFTDLMLMMFTRFGKQDIIIENCETGKDKIRLFRWVIAQKIAGDNVEFNCLLSVPPKLLFQMASTMLDDNISVLDELTLDATKEFVNVANGNACARLSENGINLTLQPPEVFETTTMPYPMQTSDVVCVHLASPDSKLEVAFEF